MAVSSKVNLENDLSLNSCHCRLVVYFPRRAIQLAPLSILHGPLAGYDFMRTGSSGRNANECFENPCDKITCRLISIFHNDETQSEKRISLVLSLCLSDTSPTVCGGRPRGPVQVLRHLGARALRPSCCWLTTGHLSASHCPVHSKYLHRKCFLIE